MRDVSRWTVTLLIAFAANATSASMPSGNEVGAEATVPVVVRVQGLALGSTLQLVRAGEILAATLNDDFRFANPATVGSSLALAVATQPIGQECRISELAPLVVPADSKPIFVRCRTLPGPHIVVPATLPDAPLRVLHADAPVRAFAYPGMPYEARLGVVGGTFPYEFRTISVSIGGVPASTSFVDLDFRHGTLRLTPASTGTIVMQIEIRDSASVPRVLTQTITLQVSDSPFVFVAPGGIDSPGRGSLAQPYRTLGYALPRTTANQIITLRAGTYVTAGFSIDDNHAKAIIGYPDEVPEVDLGYAGAITVRVNQAPVARLENLDVRHVQQYGVYSDPSVSGLVLRQVRFVEGKEGSTPSENPAFVHAVGDNPTTPRHALIVQDCDFGPFQMFSSGAYALTLFDAGDSLVENNQLRLGATTGGIHDKDNSQGNTYRENYIAFSAANANSGGIQVSAQANSVDVHIHHNLLINTGIRLGLQCFQETCYMRNHDVHHNTIVGAGLMFGWGVFNPTSFGTRFSHNIVSNGSSAPYAWHACLNSVPVDFNTQLETGANLIETTSTQAMHDTECSGGPMNMSWSTWRNTRGMDTEASGSVMTATSALVGSGPILGLPANDPLRPQWGHLYLIAPASADLIFANGFD